MDIHYDFRYSLEETGAEIAKLEQYVGVADEPLVENETVQELQNAMQHRVAYAASELMTGMRWHSEREQYLQAYEVYGRLLGAVALDGAYRAYDETGDIDKTKRSVKGYLKTSKLEMVALDYQKRLQRSPVERAKQDVAQNGLVRAVVPHALTAAGSLVGFAAAASFLRSNEGESLSNIDFTFTQQGMATAAMVASGLVVRSAVRGASRQAGTLLGNQFNANLLPYLLDTFDDKTAEGESSDDLKYLMGRYALRHLKAQLHETSDRILDYVVEDRDDIAPMVADALEVVSRGTHRSYGVNPDKEWPGPWYVSAPSRVLRVNVTTS